MSFSPSAVVWRNMIHVFHQGLYDNGELWLSYHDGQNWQPDQQVPGVSIGTPGDYTAPDGIAPMSPSAVVFNNNCYVFYLNAQQNLSYKFADGTSWSNEGLVQDVPQQCGYVGCVVFCEQSRSTGQRRRGISTHRAAQSTFDQRAPPSCLVCCNPPGKAA